MGSPFLISRQFLSDVLEWFEEYSTKFVGICLEIQRKIFNRTFRIKYIDLTRLDRIIM